MNAHASRSSQEIDQITADLIAEVLTADGIHNARQITLHHFQKWFHLVQGFWLAESRDPAVSAEGSVFLNALVPFDGGMMEIGNAFRSFNPVLKAVLADPKRAPVTPADLVSKREWDLNPFRAEVVQPMGLIYAISFNLDEGDLAGHRSIFTPVLSRDGKDFSNEERLLLSRTRTLLEPIFAYIRQREMLHALEDQAQRIPPAALSKAEAQVFEWLSQGKRNKEIALILGRSHRTVEKHVQSILLKTGAETRTAAVQRFG